jgi:hypothetical protein
MPKMVKFHLTWLTKVQPTKAHMKLAGDNVALGSFFVGRTLVRQLLVGD